MKRRVNVISLGCSKTLIDSERLLRRLADAGYDAVHEAADTRPDDIVVVNTCGFIGDAKQESIDTILRCVRAKEQGLVEKVYVMGCLSQRYRTELPAEIPEVDGWWGKRDWPQLAATLAKAHPGAAPYDRMLTTPSHHAYLKVSEGCNRRCAFCAIPLITGPHTSRDAAEILEEARMLAGRGVRELNVIAQDLSAYGTDIKGNPGLAGLTSSLASVPGIERIRLHYAYPAGFPCDVLPVMASRPNVCRYLDLALQHSSDRVLTAMRRHITATEQEELLERIRSEVPGIHLRTTLMVGFPGEGEREFVELLDFVRRQRFERMGAFAYCEEEGTWGARSYTDSVPQHEKQRRLDALMALQQEISDELQQQKVGLTLPVMLDRCEADGVWAGRTEFDSPEVDPEVLVTPGDVTRPLAPGQIVDVKITAAGPFELQGTAVGTPR